MTSMLPEVAADRTPVDRPRLRLTVGVCVCVVAIAFGSIAVGTALPAAARDLHGLRYYSWSFSLFLVGMLFSTVLAGRLADRVAPARPWS